MSSLARNAMRHDEESAAMHAPASGASSCPSPSTPADPSAPPAAAPEVDGALLAAPARGEVLLALGRGVGAVAEDAGRPLTPASRWGGRVEADAAAAASSDSSLSSTAGRDAHHTRQAVTHFTSGRRDSFHIRQADIYFTTGRQVGTRFQGQVG